MQAVRIAMLLTIVTVTVLGGCVVLPYGEPAVVVAPPRVIIGPGYPGYGHGMGRHGHGHDH